MPDNPGVTLTYPYGAPPLSATIKNQPEDFIVNEQLGFSLTGEGEHLFLLIEKRLITTHQLIEQLANMLDVSPRQTGYSGLKDKEAVTQQWISIQMPGCKQFPDIPDTKSYRILHREWHNRKLRVGSHKSNEFIITVKDIKGQSSDLDANVQNIKAYGFANFFGEQRFGQKQDNVQQALIILNHPHKRKRLTRTKKSLFLSAIRSELFNQVLCERIRQGIWEEPVAGDVYQLAGSQSQFYQPLDNTLIQRYREFDLHSGIAMYGSGKSANDLLAKEIENTIYQQNPELVKTLQNNEVKLSYRANRAVAKDLHMTWVSKDQLEMKVVLPRGCYVTTLLNHIFAIR